MPVIAEAPRRKVYPFGIETLPDITYQGWEPGREYTKNIVLKNVQVKTLKVQYKAPKTRFFTTLYPKTIVLSAGTSYCLPVTFRPLEKNTYEDAIQFNVFDEVFDVPITAVLPKFEVSIPKDVACGLAAIKDEARCTFLIANRSELGTPFKWVFEDPFVVEPAEGHLEPFESYTMSVTFRPQEAQVYRCEAKCTYGRAYECQATTALLGTGKYPFLQLCSNGVLLGGRDAELHFGPIPIGQSRQKVVDVVNESSVEAKFTVEQPSTAIGLLDRPFSCMQWRGSVPPGGSIPITITFKPGVAGTTSTDYFKISTLSSAGVVSLKCTGSCEGPLVTLSSNAVNFSLIDVGQEATACLEIRNGSHASCFFQFAIDHSQSVFKIEPLQGLIDANSIRKCIIKFCPSHPINYYRQIVCIVENQEPLFLDLLGTAHSELIKPAVVEVQHVARFRTHCDRGLSMFPPEVLNDMLSSKKLDLDSNGCLMSLPAEAVEPYCEPSSQPCSVERYFNDGHHADIVYNQPHVSLDSVYADFGRCTDMKNIEPRCVVLTNHTKGKIAVQWMGNDSQPFFVTPASIDIPPLKTASFRVTFKPDAPNVFYGTELECYCSYKSLRDYRLVEGITHAPPFCVTLTATGSTFQPGHEPFLPTVRLSTNPLVLAAVHAQESAYATMTLHNVGSTPLVYSVDNVKASSRHLSAKPCLGYVSPGQCQILTLKAVPPRTGIHRSSLYINLNYDDKNTEKVTVNFSAESSEVFLSNKGEVYLRPTCVGAASSCIYTVKNVSRMPLSFDWLVPGSSRAVLAVRPPHGTIMPNEEQQHVFDFMPQKAEKYIIKPNIMVQLQAQGAMTTTVAARKTFPVRVIGEGSQGTIVAEQSYVDFGDVVVGSSETKAVVLVNNADCTLHYRLSVEQSIEGNASDGRLIEDLIALHLDEPEGQLAARSRKVVRCTVKPVQRVSYRFAIAYELSPTKQHATGGSGDEAGRKGRRSATSPGPLQHQQLQLLQQSRGSTGPMHLCHVLASGVFPQLRVMDARVHGSGIGMSKQQLWSLLQLDSLNMFFASDPSEKELMYSVATRQSTQRRPPVHTRAVLDFNFAAAPVGSAPFNATLQVENVGAVPSEWEFLYPSDLQMELDYWADTGELNDDELHEIKVMDNKLFTVEPKKGRLQPGESQAITFTYKHIMVGVDRLSVLLKLSRGREILINFAGVTVEKDKPYLHFASLTHTFEPVCIGEKDAPKQVYELYNGGSIPVRYELDTLALEIARRENFEHPIFSCANPVGVVQPGTSASIEWRFSPLEAKTYKIDIPIRAHNAETTLITFVGIGYDKTVMGETMPLNSETAVTGVPAIQKAVVQGQKLILSHERLSFGNMPLFCRARRVIFLRNVSASTISYAWHVTNERNVGVVDVLPASGTLGPHESRMLKISFSSAGTPGFFDIDLLCEVVDESLMAAYRKALQNWENECERQRVEFTITEKDIDADRRLWESTENRANSESSGWSQGGIVTKPLATSAALSYKPYQTLPPIIQSSADDLRAAADETKRLKAVLWQRPKAPEPFLLHLGVTARTHGVGEFQESFPGDYGSFFVDRSLKTDGSTQGPAGSPRKIVTNQMETDLVVGVIGNVLRTLVDDVAFHGAVEDLDHEATPYFRQLGDQLRLRAAAASRPPSSPPDKRRARSAEERLRTPLGSGDLSPLTAPSQFEFDIADVTSPSPGPVQATTPTGDKETGDERLHSASALAERVLRSATVSLNLEDLLEKTISNIILEAASGEFNITSRPRLVALPPNAKR